MIDYGAMVRVRLLLAISLLALPTAAFGQSTAPLLTDPGATLTVDAQVIIVTSGFGTLNGTDTDTAAATGSALITLFPSDPPFTHATVHSLSLGVDTLNFQYSFVFGLVQMSVTVEDLLIQSTASFDGTIDAGGNALFQTAPLHTTGSARVVSAALGVDQTELIDVSSAEVLEGMISEAGGVVTLDNVIIPPSQVMVDPASLPVGVTSVTANVMFSTPNLVFTGMRGPSNIGDADQDGDIDSSDYPSFFACLAGPEDLATIYCSLMDFDGDADVDLVDFAEFQAAFTGP